MTVTEEELEKIEKSAIELYLLAVKHRDFIQQFALLDDSGKTKIIALIDWLSKH